ncbi:hypothetical protein [Endozoicomonas sp. SCSIO W0465]|uniref:hypothetical protein n=1 Tax=Endozoicomonas sp. SCSIO W0465 TaxID=2918516 RepID=UPI0020761489|nr:hypothetical protein [Endozoicomonas sp. SCSIO W0465]USE34539.1 hypothetical protein MJO57_20665 [Endozoicomonas sp. SCSIO W0465]
MHFSDGAGMQFEVEVLNGARQGMRFNLPLAYEVHRATTSMPYVLETEALALFVRMDRACDRLSLILGERVLTFTQGRNSHALEFEWYPPYRENGARDALFYNYFGVAKFTLKLESEGSVESLDTGPVEVLARNRTAKQAGHMVNFILAETDSDLNDEGGTTRFQGAASHREQLNLLVERILNNASKLEGLAAQIFIKPIRTLTTDMALQRGADVYAPGDQSLAWLMYNLSVLEETDDKSQSHLHVDGRMYWATELLAPVIREHTDVYENRVLSGYLDSLLSVIADLLKHYAPTELSRLQNAHEGYVSFFACMEAWIHQVNSQQLVALKACQEQILSLRQQFMKRLPVRKSVRALPRITAKVRGSQHYLTLFRMVIDWYQHLGLEGKTPQQQFLAINSMPGLFEYYAFIRIRRWFLAKGLQENPGIGKPHLLCTRENNLAISLHYEPVFWMVGNSKAGNIINTENRSVSEARNNYPGRTREWEFAQRKPDITLEVRRNGQLIGLLVLDAKFTTREQAFSQYLPECTMKYVHGITDADSVSVNGGLVKAMIILYPHSHDELLDFHAAPFDAYGDQRQIPVLGAQSLSLETSEPCVSRSIESLLDRLLTLFESNSA